MPRLAIQCLVLLLSLGSTTGVAYPDSHGNVDYLLWDDSQDRDTCYVPLPGDVTADGRVTAADVICIVNFVFLRGPCQPQPCNAAADMQCSGTVSSADIIYLVNYIFKSGPEPCDICTVRPPGTSCI